MNFRISAILAIGILFTACKKTETQPNTIPPPPDTTVIVGKVDTSTLLKTNSTYNYDAGGIEITDSSVSQWTYDNQRRIVLQTFKGSGFDVSNSYTYQTDRYTYSAVINFNGALQLKSEVTYYQHIPGRTDSVVSESTGYGTQAGSNSRVVTFFYYNQANQDSLEKSYNVINNIAYFSSSVNKYYTGNNLDSSVSRDNSGIVSFIKYFAGGNQSSAATYSNGVQSGTLIYTYSNISSGGLFMIMGASKLMTEYTSVTIPATTTFTETNTYAFDSENRVVSVSRDHHGSSPNQKEVYIYY